MGHTLRHLLTNRLLLYFADFRFGKEKNFRSLMEELPGDRSPRSVGLCVRIDPDAFHVRQRKASPSRDVVGHERPRTEWIEIPVRALVSEEMFALAQEQFEKIKHRCLGARLSRLYWKAFWYANSAATACTAHSPTGQSTS